MHCVFERVLLSARVLLIFVLLGSGLLVGVVLFLLSTLISLGVGCMLLNTGCFPCLAAPSFIRLSMVSIVSWSMSCVCWEHVIIFVGFMPPVANSCAHSWNIYSPSCWRAVFVLHVVKNTSWQELSNLHSG